jgi:acyl-coenzyme A synthetase/AMP-(fatty) acid ligase
VLAAWRAGKPVCAIESGQSASDFGTLPNECAHLKVTSATTGQARAVLFTAAQLAADAANIVATMGLTRESPNIGVISMAHSYGFSNLVLPLLLHGIPLYLGMSLPESLRSIARDANVSFTLPAVPALWRAWHEAKAIPQNIRLAISAGAPLSIQLEESIWGECRLKIHNFYGATECGGIAYDESSEPRSDPACVGKAMRNVSLTQTNDGCLEVTSEAVGMTYWPAADVTLGNGRFRTSDLVELRDGLVFLRGRAGDQINVAGRKIAPEIIEQALLADSRVRECVVLGIPAAGERTDEIAVVLALKQKCEVAELRAELARRLPAWQIPREWIILDALPVNERGKLSRAELRRGWNDLKTQRRST